MNSDSPFTIHGDETLEARIVAWVLGEASAFEAAELERLCEERPELLVFRRRMRALHGLLTEAESARPDEGWKLPEEKRRVLDEIFGEEKVLRLDVAKETRIRRSGRRTLLAIAACLVLTFFVIRLMPWKQESEAIVEVKPRRSVMASLADGKTETSGAEQMTPQFFGTEFEKIKSRRNLEKVVDNLDLTDRWKVDKETALKIVKDSVETENVRGTDLISIRARHANKQDADDIASEVAQSYAAYRNEIEAKDTEKELHELNKAVRDQEDKVDERRKVLATIARTKGIIYKGDDSLRGVVDGTQEVPTEGKRELAAKNAVHEEAIKRGLDAQDYVDAKREFDADQELLQKMKLKLIGEDISSKTDSSMVEIHQLPSSPNAKKRDSVRMAGALSADEAGTVAIASAERQRKWGAGGVALKPSAVPPVVAAESASVMGEIAAETEPLKSIDGVSEFKSGNASGGVGGGSFGLASSVTAESAPPPPAKPASAVAVNGGALAKDAPALPDMDLAKLQVSGISNYPGEMRPTIVAGFARSNDTDHYSDRSAGNGRFAGGGEAIYQYNLGIKNAEPLAVLGGEVFYSQDDRSETSELAKQVPPPTMSDRSPLADNNLPAIDKKMKESQDMPALGNRIDATTGALAWSGAGTLQLPPPVITAAPAASAPASATTDGGMMDGNLRLHDLADGSKREPAGPLAGEKSKSEPVDALATDGAIRTNAASSNGNVDEVRRSLYTAEGNFNLGKYDDAKHGYEDTLRKDPYNAAARRGLERIASAKSNYDRAAYDHTRAELLSQVDNSWELAVPAEGVDHEKGGKIEVVRESRNPAEPSPPVAPEGVVAQSKFQVTPATPTSGMLQEEGDKKALGDLPAIEEPKPSLTELMEEIPAVEDPYSTFSLNISDASFQIAQAAMAKGERPDPAGIKVEQFYNAVDYGDPAPSAGEPVAVNIEQSAHPVIPGRNLVRIALKTAAAGRSAAQPLRLTLLVDQSGSMVREDRRAAMDKALAGLAGLLTDKDLVTVIGFSRTPRLQAENLQGDKAGNLADLVNQSASEGGTNLEEAIKLAEQKADLRKLAGAQNRIVLFTDGAANLGNADPIRLAEKVKELRQKGISFDIAGIAAEDLNDELLGGLARNGNGRYYVVGKGADSDFAKQLAGAFRPAAENVKVQVHFNPERVGRYKLIGFEKDRLKTEDFRNDAVDAAELAAEEAGVAVYQIEPLPGGSGELGEVSVRFRDTAGNQMVERSWTIPHDDKAPAFDRATPSMQLAVLSMLAAEKLKGGPLADAIDFQQLAEPRANVKRFYGGSGRVGEVLRMVDALK